MPETTNDSYLVDGRRLRAHPATNCFPLMRGTDFEALVADIWKNGCRVPVVIFDDFLLDGRNRALACERAGLTVPWETLPAGAAQDATLAVMSLNLHRRHMEPGQRAMAAAKLANLPAGRPTAAAAEPAGGAADSGKGRLVRPNGETAPIGAVSQTTAADRMNVSRRSTQRAAAIKDDPDLAPAVERGHVAVGDAYRVRNEPPDVKRRAVEAFEAGKAATLVRAVKRIKQDEAQEQATAEAANAPPVPNLHGVPIGELKTRVGPGSVDIIATIPPPARGSVEGGVYGDLGQFAVHALRPGGVLLTRAASAHLPRVLQQLAVEGLEYRWIVACYEPDGRTRINARKVTTSWRPWLVYTRSGARPDRNSADYFPAPEGEAAETATPLDELVREWAEPGWVLFDPFCGVGAVLVAGRRAGLHVGGADDAGNVVLARQALEAETEQDEVADLNEAAAGPLPHP